MERIEVIEQTAAALRAQHRAGTAGRTAAQQIESICKALKFTIRRCSDRDVALGGAYSRLKLWVWNAPRHGGIIWLRDDLDAEMRLFAIAHELGHFALHRGEGIATHGPCDSHAIDQQADPASLRVDDRPVQEYTPRARRELEANAFAAELLAPRTEVRRHFTASAQADASRIAAFFGISQVLAHRRLIDAVLTSTRPLIPIPDPAEKPVESAAPSHDSSALLAQLDASQRAAAQAEGPALVVAGPGTGKTATLVGRVAYLVGERHIPPERVLALTFSNRAASEMRTRLSKSGLPGERMPIMTIHAFCATLLREYYHRVPHAPDEAELQPDFQILDSANSYLLMEELLGVLPLRYYRSLGNPTAHVKTLLQDFSQARDGLLTPAKYAALVDDMPEEPPITTEHESPPAPRSTKKHKPPEGYFTREQIAKARERSNAYAVWDQALRQRGLLDFGSLVQRAVELLQADASVLDHVRNRYPQIVVDEFQDTNHAAGELLLLLAGADGAGLWVVGDRNQSIYRFRGASPGNLQQLAAHYPGLHVLTLRRCYRSVPAIVRLGSAMAARMADLAPASSSPALATGALREALQPLVLESARSDTPLPAIQRTESFANAAEERAGLVAAIQRYHAAGYAFGEQAILCRTHKQVRQFAGTLAAHGIPVSQLDDFFDRPEIKDARMLLSIAAGEDARGVLRAESLLLALGFPPPAGAELAATVHFFSAQRRSSLPWLLRDEHLLHAITTLSPQTRAGLLALGNEAASLHHSDAIGHRLAAFLLRRGGYAWQLARIADGLDSTASSSLPSAQKGVASAQQALAALGELVRLAWRFDMRWAQEPDFRAQLSRAVSYRRPARPPLPDTLTPAPNADVIPTDSSAASSRTTTAPPAVRCFLHYLDALRTTDVSVPIPAGEDDTVHVLTLHQSKGLEFPVVLLPALAQGQFPTPNTNRDEICPPHFRESDLPGERDAEERCLFYVGATRARDVLGFSRATSYATSSAGNPQMAKPSPLLPLLHDTDEWEHAEPLVSPTEHHASALWLSPDDIIADEAIDDDGDEGDDAEPVPSVASAGNTDTPAKPTFELRELEEYLICPRRYKYGYPYGLFNSAYDPVHRFHRYIRRGLRQMRETREQEPQTTWDATQRQLRDLWETEGPAGHAYDAYYWKEAEAVLRQEWQALISPEEAKRSRRVTLEEPLTAELRACFVSVKADRVIADAGATPDQALTVLVRMHIGQPKQDDYNDLTLSLYYLAYQQSHPNTPIQIALAYKGKVLSHDAIADHRDNQPELIEDVTAEARDVATRYLAQKKQARLNRLDRAARGIIDGQFAPKPQEYRCATCPYCYICPADPDPAMQPSDQVIPTFTEH